MDPDVADLARRAAASLSDRFGDRLPAQVEAAIRGGEPARRFAIDPLHVELAALVIHIAHLFWAVYENSRKSAERPPPQEVMLRRVRLEVEIPPDVTPAMRDAIAAAVAAEIAKLARPSPPDPPDGPSPDR